jgi:hypothetical protein
MCATQGFETSSSRSAATLFSPTPVVCHSADYIVRRRNDQFKYRFRCIDSRVSVVNAFGGPLGVPWSPLESVGVHWSPLEVARSRVRAIRRTRT